MSIDQFTTSMTRSSIPFMDGALNHSPHLKYIFDVFRGLTGISKGRWVWIEYHSVIRVAKESDRLYT
ncbi:MAG: hypothetical protein ACTSRK_20980 [Promethearchaeota archaeon]